LPLKTGEKEQRRRNFALRRPHRPVALGRMKYAG
jgi:hypothetical protein